MSSGIFRLTFTIEGEALDVEQTQKEVVLGRHPNCDVQVSGEAISRFHAKIIQDDLGWSVVDLKSVNGTQVNQQNVTKLRLTDQDQITLGSLDLVFHVVEAPKPEIVAVEDDSEPMMTQCINVDEFKQMLEGGASPPKPGDGTPTLARSPAPKREDEGTYDWAFPVVSKAAQALISCNDLDEMFERVMDLVFEHLPAERGCIVMYDTLTKERSQRVTRTKGSAPGERFSYSTNIVRKAIDSRNAGLYTDILNDQNLAEQQSIIINKIRSAMAAPLYSGEGDNVGGVIYVDTQNSRHPFRKVHLEVLTTLAMLSSVALEQAELRDHIHKEAQARDRLQRYLSPSLVDRFKDGVPDEMIAEELEVSILFLDLSGFTAMSENLDPRAVANVLNEVFGRFTEVVFEFDGTLDKFMGDGMMAIFGAPIPQDDHAIRSVKAALHMQEALLDFNEKHENASLRMRIGINSGVVTAGDIGSPQRKDYTVIGDAVNVASRLESSVAKPDQIVIGPRTHELLCGGVPCEQLEEVHVKGRGAAVKPFLVTS